MSRWFAGLDLTSVRVTRMAFAVAALCVAAPGTPLVAQSVNFMQNECSSIGQTFYRDFNASTEMQYNGQRVDGTHAVNGMIYLENRAADFACSYESSGRRMVAFYAEGRLRNAYLPGGAGTGAGAGAGGSPVVRVTGVSANDVLNLRSGPGTGYRVIGALSNGTEVHRLSCRNVGSSQWCNIRMMDDMRSEGWVNGRYLTGPGAAQGGTATHLPSPPPTGAGQTTTTRVRFPAGTTGTEIAETLKPGATRRYLLGARDRQFLYVRLAARGADLWWRLLNPDGTLLDEGSAAKAYRGQLWQSGDHVVELRNRGDRTRKYTVMFDID